MSDCSMSITNRAATITESMITAASMLVRITHSENASLLRALAKAEPRLLVHAWTIESGVLVISSHSHPSDVRLCDGDTCDCECSRGVCWHRACWYLLSAVAAVGINPLAPIPLPTSILDDDAGYEDYPDSFLDSLPCEDTIGSITDGHDEYGDVLPVAPSAFYEVDDLPVFASRRPAPAIPFRPRSIELVPAAGSDFARAQADADRLFAA